VVLFEVLNFGVGAPATVAVVGGGDVGAGRGFAIA